ncbi:AraC family transcriptional regulator [Enterococcus sp. AZ093]
MEKKHINGKEVNTMISDQYEIYHVKDIVSQNKTVYHHHDFYEIHATLEGEAIFLFRWSSVYDPIRKCFIDPFKRSASDRSSIN